MAKKKEQPTNKGSDHRRAMKVARTEANRIRRAQSHTIRRKQQEGKCLKTQRGTARALRRYTDRTSREFPEVLRGKYSMSMLVRVPKRAEKAKPASLGLLINGKQMGSMTEALWTARQIAEGQRERQQHAHE